MWAFFDPLPQVGRQTVICGLKPTGPANLFFDVGLLTGFGINGPQRVTGLPSILKTIIGAVSPAPFDADFFHHARFERRSAETMVGQLDGVKIRAVRPDPISSQ